MPRILPLPETEVSPETFNAYRYHEKTYNGRITNMKATLGYSHIAFEAYMQWYPLYREVKEILGDRLSPIFAWAISEASDCPLCSTYFRKMIIESGENPEELILSENDRELLTFGAGISLKRGFITEEEFKPVRERFSDREIVILTAFAGIMIATNIFNNVIHTEIDEYLNLFRSNNL